MLVQDGQGKLNNFQVYLCGSLFSKFKTSLDDSNLRAAYRVETWAFGDTCRCSSMTAQRFLAFVEWFHITNRDGNDWKWLLWKSWCKMKNQCFAALSIILFAVALWWMSLMHALSFISTVLQSGINMCPWLPHAHIVMGPHSWSHPPHHLFSFNLSQCGEDVIKVLQDNKKIKEKQITSRNNYWLPHLCR